MKTPHDFSGRVALVTGGASGIGLACAHTLASGGARVMLADRQAEPGEAAVAQIRQAGGEALFVPVEVADPASVQAMVDATVKAFGRLDIAVNNAGVGGVRQPVATHGVADWQRIIGINHQCDDLRPAAGPVGERGGLLQRDVARAFRKEHEAHEVGACVQRRIQRLGRRKPADLDLNGHGACPECPARRVPGRWHR